MLPSWIVGVEVHTLQRTARGAQHAVRSSCGGDKAENIAGRPYFIDELRLLPPILEPRLDFEGRISHSVTALDQTRALNERKACHNGAIRSERIWEGIVEL